MPIRIKTGKISLMEVFSEFSPKLMSNGQIRMECPFRENHTDGSGTMSFFATPDMNAYHCFAGETRVPTDEGTFFIKDLAGKSARVLSSNGKFVSASFKFFGRQQLWRLDLVRDGVEKTIYATCGHRWFLCGRKSEVVTENLRVGSYLQSVDFLECTEYAQSLRGIRHGIVFGDGTLDKSRKAVKSLVNLHGVKMQLAAYFSDKEIRGVKCRDNGDRYMRVYHVRRGSKFKQLPSLSSSLAYLRGFLAGYIATDGCFTTRGILMLHSARYDDLEFCRQAFFRLGISTGVICSQMRKGYGGVEKPIYSITIKTKNLDPTFFIRGDQRNRFNSVYKKYERNRWKIVSVTKTNKVEDVFCAEVPTYHSFALEDNILTGNCFSCGCKGNLVRLLTTRFSVNYFEAMDMVHLTDYTPAKKEFDLDIMWDTSKPPKEFIDRGYDLATLLHFKVGTMDNGKIVIPYYKDFNCSTELVGYQIRDYSGTRRVLNSKGFERANYLYNWDNSYAYVVLVEGQSDVWRLYQFGYNAIGLMGNDISKWQVQQLSEFDRVYLALDNDIAGRKGTEICYHSLKNHTDVRLVPYQTKDPGSCTSKKDWESAFHAHSDYVEYSLEMSMGWDGYLDMRDEVLHDLKNRE